MHKLALSAVLATAILTAGLSIPKRAEALIAAPWERVDGAGRCAGRECYVVRLALSQIPPPRVLLSPSAGLRVSSIPPSAVLSPPVGVMGTREPSQRSQSRGHVAGAVRRHGLNRWSCPCGD